jgi:hypothetical protein
LSKVVLRRAWLVGKWSRLQKFRVEVREFRLKFEAAADKPFAEAIANSLIHSYSLAFTSAHNAPSTDQSSPKNGPPIW